MAIIKSRLVAFIVIIGFLASCEQGVNPINCAVPLDNTEDSKDLAILFIGTSHTYYNNMPDIIKKIGKSIGDSVHIKMSAPGGYDFERHVTLQTTLDALDSSDWDYIILQESGWRTALPQDRLNTQVFPFAKELKKIISEKQPLAKLILYMTNGYTKGVGSFNTSWCEDEPLVCSYDGMQNRIRDTYVTLSKTMNAEIAPAGMVWKSLIEKKSNIPLFDPDGIHPSLNGSYVHALTIYSLVRRKELKNIFVPTGISNDDAILIQDAVVDMVFQCTPNWTTF